MNEAFSGAHGGQVAAGAAGSRFAAQMATNILNATSEAELVKYAAAVNATKALSGAGMQVASTSDVAASSGRGTTQAAPIGRA